MPRLRPSMILPERLTLRRHFLQAPSLPVFRELAGVLYGRRSREIDSTRTSRDRGVKQAHSAHPPRGRGRAGKLGLSS